MSAEPEQIPEPTAGISRATRQHLRQAVEPLLVPDTAAAALAGVSRATWHRLRAAGKLPPAIRIPGCRAVRWRRADVENWITAGCPDARTWAAMQAAAGRRKVV
jgi:predicted DNA-binding transcriptional regulator AlpA